MVKVKDDKLKITDMLTQKSKHIGGFQTPEAFVYIYEREQFISL
jgi:hypothetical protein